MRSSVLLALLLSVSAHAKEAEVKTEAIKADTDVAQKQKQEEVKRIQERMKSYQKRGMDYAAALWSRNDGTMKDDSRQRRSDALGYKLRRTTITRTQTLLGKTRNPKMVATLKKRLAELYEKQANAEAFLFGNQPGKQELWKGTLRRAIKIRTDLLAKDKRYVRPDVILFALAENYKTLEDVPRADQNYRNIVSGYPKSVFLADALLALGNIRYDQKIFSAARTYYRKILEVRGTPLLAYAHYKIAWAYFNEQNEKAAISSLIDAVKTGRRMSKARKRRLDVEEEALRDLVLFYAESGDPLKAKDFFEKIVPVEQAKELRYMLARRYFAHDKHNKAMLVATRLLNDKPSDNYAGQLLMITLSISEKTKQRKLSVASASRLSDWVIRVRDKFKGKKYDDEIEMVMTDAEESIRRLAHRLHFDAQKGKQNNLWGLAKDSYEIYFKTYAKTEEMAEMRYRYSALLFKLRLNPEAHANIEILLAMIKPGHKRHQEAMKLRIQAIEQANKEQRKVLTDKKLIIAYDAYAKAFPKDKLSVEALFKAGKLAKKEEGPVKAAVRFRELAKAYPNHRLRDAAVKEALASLLEAQEWQNLAEESKALIGVVATAHETKTGEKLVDDGKVDTVQIERNPIYKQLLNARNTAMLKIAEEYEAKKKYEEAEKAYLEFINSRKNSTLRPMALVKLAAMNENKVLNFSKAVEYWEQIDKEYGNTKTGKTAELEQARIHEKIMRPKKAVINYLNFAQRGNSKVHVDSLTNAAVILEALGEWNLAANNFLKLSSDFAKSKDKNLKAKSYQMYQFSCKNRLLAVAKSPSKEVLEKLQNCATVMSTRTRGDESILWLVRGAWTAEKLGDKAEANKFWAKIASARNLLVKKPELSLFLAMAKTKQLVPVLAKYKEISFANSNENPNANIARKTKALEKVEAVASDIMKYGSDREVKIAKQAMQIAYINFGETLETSAVPSGLSDVDKKVLRESFLQAAQEMRNKAKEYEIDPKAEKENREVASREKIKERSYPSLSRNEFKELIVRAANNPNDVEAYARLAYHMFDKEEFATARYIAMKWENLVEKGKGSGDYSKDAFEEFKKQVGLKVPEADPILMEIQNAALGGA